MNLLYKKVNATYGGYDYVEVDTDKKVYALGDSRGHTGHGKSASGRLEVAVKTLKELSNLESDLIRLGFKEVPTMYGMYEGQ